MNTEKALSLYSRIESDGMSQNLYARSNARYILFGVQEPRGNFPQFLEKNLDNGSDMLGFLYLAIACTLSESKFERYQIIQNSFEKAAEFIEYNHLPKQNRNRTSQYYLLISALSYYAAQQYSKAFIIVREVESYETDLAILCSSFLKKDFAVVHSLLNKILLDSTYFNSEDSIEKTNQKQQLFIFAKAISNLMDYMYTGDSTSLEAVDEILDDLLNLLMLEQEPSMWWVVRIFKIISEGFFLSSLWGSILPRFDSGDSLLVKQYIYNLIFGKKPIMELFNSQREALPLVFNEKGAVICLPTSSGKTQIAALGILQCLIDNPKGKILYLAPYRSLAYEVESTLKEIFEPLSYHVSQLYGTGQFSKLDNMLIEDTNILIATPEKAKVILRANESVTKQIMLIIIDEGHLLDDSKRNVINELFVEELKLYAAKNNGKIILLSAVLPNSEDISKWICNDNENYIAGQQRLARQRLGILHFKTNRNLVNLEWFGEEKSFNSSFIKPIAPTGRKKLFQPQDRKIAVALTALRLSDINKAVLIFTSRAVSAPTYARAVIKASGLLNKSDYRHQWNNNAAYEEFKLLCAEYKSAENEELLTFAEFGILCHYGSLNRDVRLAMEKLMRESNPTIIVATMTLGQGVNLGVSTVIIADTSFYDSVQKEHKALTSNEIWNVIGRGGRAFQDIEGKILFVSEKRSEEKVALKYIDGLPDNAYSGLLKKIIFIVNIARECGVDFELLLEMISNNDLRTLGKRKIKKTGTNVKKEVEDVFDWIDDVLLSININNGESIDDRLRQTLAYIQASEYGSIEQDDVFKFLEARNTALKNIIAPDRSQWKNLISSSLPLASAISLDKVYDEIVENAETYLESDQKIKDKIELLKMTENIIESFPSSSFKPKLDSDGNLKFSQDLMDEARDLWIRGKPLTTASDVRKVIDICNKHFAYTVSWALGAIANKLSISGRDDLSTLFERLALSCELGLPDDVSAKIYLSGIKSRTAAMEISKSWQFILVEDFTIRETRSYILENIDDIKEEALDPLTIGWLNLMVNDQEKNRSNQRKKKIKNFSLPSYPDIKTKRLYVKSLTSEDFYLCNHDYEEIYPIQNSTNWPFDTIANSQEYFFEFSRNVWKFRSAKK